MLRARFKQILIKMKRIIYLLLLLAFVINNLYGQEDTLKKQRTTQQQDVFYIFTKKSKRDSLTKKAKPLIPNKLYISVLPYVGYDASFGFLGGVSFNSAICLGPIATTPVSAFAIGITYTAKKQALVLARSNFFTKNADWLMRGDWRWYFYSQPTYGLGSGSVPVEAGPEPMSINTGGVGYSVKNIAEPMRFKYIRFYESFYRRIIGKLYLGLGFYYDRYYNILDQSLKLDTIPPQLTAHFEHSAKHYFIPGHYNATGITTSLIIDTRDNSIRPTQGMFFDFEMRFNPLFFGSTGNSIRMYTEFRTYLRLSKKNPAHLIAFWNINSIKINGDEPYLILPAVGWDTYNRTARGYVQGRIRGVNLVYGETEYRFPISPYTRILSGVVFANITTASNDADIKLFKFFDPAAGLGLRIMLNKTYLSNLTIDYGFGVNGSHGLTLNINETF
jgi:hypothetical protein